MSEAPANVWVPPPKVEDLFAAAGGTQFASINAPTSGARVQKDVPTGPAPFQLYSLATPNGMKPAILLEELGIDYDAHSTYSIYSMLFQNDCNFLIFILHRNYAQRRAVHFRLCRHQS